MKIENIEIFKDKKLNNLGELLKEKIKSSKNPFKTITVIFPNNKVAQWFRSYWLKTEDSVLMNVKFQSLEEGLTDLLDLNEKYRLVKREELRTNIIKQLVNFNNTELEYIYDGKTLDSIRLYDLANTLSKLFLSYEKDETQLSGFQEKIYDSVLSELYKKKKGTFGYIYKQNKKFKKVEEVIFFGFSYLDKLYVNFISELGLCADVTFYQIDSEIDYKIEPKLLSAPSKTREIEMIHSEICKLVLDEDVKYSDILVIANDISKYEMEISKVFNQDNKDYPSIPFSINAKNSKMTFDTVAIKKLFEIALKGFYTRLDFNELINNKTIQEARGILLEDVDNWVNAILEMNVYRNGKSVDDWLYAKRRVILSKVSSINSVDNNVVLLSCGKYTPYTNISFDDSSMCRFIKIIDDLDRWIKEFNKNVVVTSEKIESLKTELEKWFSIKDQYGHEKSKIYKKFSNELDLWRYCGLLNKNIPLNTLFYTLFDLSEDIKGNISNMFVRGVSFADYEENVSLSAKYVFIIGLSSNEFPSKNTISEIDLREEVRNTNELSSFICQCNNATNALYLSHINYDLKSDEEFFPSSYILKLYEKLNIELFDKKTKNVKYDIKIGVDETRPWSQLFTKKEFKEKDYYYSLFKTNGNNDLNSKSVKNELDEKTDLEKVEKKEIIKVTVSQMKNFLTEPLKYKAETLFGSDVDILDQLKDEYEPYLLSSLDKSSLVKVVISYLLRNLDIDIVYGDGTVNLDIAKLVFERFIIEHKIPDINIDVENNSIKGVVKDALAVVDRIKKLTGGNFKVIKLDDLKLSTKNKDIIYSFSGELCLSYDDVCRKYIEISNSKADKFDLLTMYLCSLIDIASLDDEINYEVLLSKGTKKETYYINSSKAKELLIAIYNEMENYDFNIFFPIEFVDKDVSYEKLLNEVNNSDGSWKYFKNRKIFQPLKHIGYTKDDFNKVIEEAKELVKKLVIYLDKEAK